MTDNRDTIRNSYLQDRLPHQQPVVLKRTTTTINGISKTLEDEYFSQSNTLIEPLFSVRTREKQSYRSYQSDRYNFNVVDYQATSTASALTRTLPVANPHKQDQQPMFPKLTPRSYSTNKQFPIISPRNAFIHVDNKNPISTTRKSLEPIPVSLRKSPSINQLMDLNEHTKKA